MTMRPLLWSARSLLHTRVLAPSSLTRQLTGIPTESHTTTHRLVDDQDKRAKAAEAVYFRKEDEKLLRQLLKKVKQQADQMDDEARKHSQQEVMALQEIVGKYKVTEADLLKLIDWRHHSFH